MLWLLSQSLATARWASSGRSSQLGNVTDHFISEWWGYSLCRDTQFWSGDSADQRLCEEVAKAAVVIMRLGDTDRSLRLLCMVMVFTTSVLNGVLGFANTDGGL